MVCIQPRNIYSRFVLFRITFFALNGSSNEKNLQNKKHKKEFCRTKSPRHGNLNHQGVFENELGALKENMTENILAQNILVLYLVCMIFRPSYYMKLTNEAKSYFDRLIFRQVRCRAYRDGSTGH